MDDKTMINDLERKYDLNGTPYYKNMYGCIVRYGDLKLGDEPILGYRIIGFETGEDYKKYEPVVHTIIIPNAINSLKEV